MNIMDLNKKIDLNSVKIEPEASEPKKKKTVKRNIYRMRIKQQFYDFQFINDMKKKINEQETFLAAIIERVEEVVWNYIYLKAKAQQKNEKEEEGEEEKKIYACVQKTEQDIYANILLDHVLSIAETLGCDLAYCNGKTYMYNGKYYEEKNPEMIAAFLEICAVKSGLDEDFSHRAKFNKLLVEQFQASAKKDDHTIDPSEVAINLQNGVYIFHSDGKHEFTKHDKKFFFRYILPFEYDETKECPKFKKYLNEVLPETESQLILSEFTGYIFAKGINLSKVLVCLGYGRNGKSLFFKIITNVLGEDNVTNFSLSELCDKNGNARAGFENKLLNYTDEMSNRFDSSNFKTLSSNEPISAKLLYRNIGKIRNYGRLATSTNKFPDKIENTHGNTERYLFVHFRRTLSKDEINPTLGDEIIKEELPGIFNWVLEGMNRIIKNKKFTESKNSDEVFNEFKEQADPLNLFLAENDFIPDNTENKRLSDFFTEFKKFCEENSFYTSHDSRQFSRQLKLAGYTVKRAGTGGYTYVYVAKRLFKEVDKVVNQIFRTKNTENDGK